MKDGIKRHKNLNEETCFHDLILYNIQFKCVKIRVAYCRLTANTIGTVIGVLQYTIQYNQKS